MMFSANQRVQFERNPLKGSTMRVGFYVGNSISQKKITARDFKSHELFGKSLGSQSLKSTDVFRLVWNFRNFPDKAQQKLITLCFRNFDNLNKLFRKIKRFGIVLILLDQILIPGIRDFSRFRHRDFLEKKNPKSSSGVRIPKNLLPKPPLLSTDW